MDCLPKQMPQSKFKLVNRMHDIDSIPFYIKKELLDLFNIKIPTNLMDNSIILLSSCYKRNIDVSQQFNVMKAVVEKSKNFNIYIKPHPRDMTDYSSLSDKIIIIDRFFPTELFNFYKKKIFTKAIGMNTTSVFSCNFAIHKEFISLKEIDYEH